MLSTPKLSPALSLSLSLPGFVRSKSAILQFSYDASGDLWTLLMLYQGSLDYISLDSFSFINLSGGFAIIEIRSNEISTLLNYNEVLYLEISSPVFFDEITGIASSCIPTDRIFYAGSSPLTGSGTAIGILDSGVDYRHPDFRNADGTTRILAYWDQTLPYVSSSTLGSPSDYSLGTVFFSADLNRLLGAENTSNLRGPSQDTSGHGTHIAGICAGNGRASGGKNIGVAPEAGLIVVKLKTGASQNVSDYSGLMLAVDFTIKYAADQGLPLGVNISFGSNYGSHDGNSMISLFLDHCSFLSKNTICVGTGNEGSSRRHYAGIFARNARQNTPIAPITVEFSIGPSESSLFLDLWKSYSDQMRYELISPSGGEPIQIPSSAGVYHFTKSTTRIDCIVSTPTPYEPLQEVFFHFSPQAALAIQSGIWQLRLFPIRIKNGAFNIWLPSQEGTDVSTGFLSPSAEKTFTIPSTSKNVLSVSAYDTSTDTFAPFSGRGFVCEAHGKPDLCAPGVNILSTAPGGGYTIKSGTSMAAPFVTGASSLLMEYGIVSGQDPFLFGEKVKAILTRDANLLPSILLYPSSLIGWGSLCIKIAPDID